MIDKYFGQLKIILLGFDAFSFIIAFVVANELQEVLKVNQRTIYLAAAFISAIMILCTFYYLKLYNMVSSYLHEAFLVAKGTFFAFLVILGLSFFYRTFSFSRLFIIYFSIFFLIIDLINRRLFRKLIRFFGNIKPMQRITLIVGCGVIGKSLVDELLLRPSVWQLAGYLDDQDDAGAYRGVPYLGKLEQIEEIVTKESITDIFIGIPSASRNIIKKLIHKCESLNINWRVVPNLYDLPLVDVHFDRLDNLPLVGPKSTNIIGINYLTKRVLDFIMSSLMIILSGPIMVIIAIAIKLTSPGPVLFRQVRVGLNGKHFTLLKFRTMYVNNNDKMHRDYATKWIKSNDSYSQDANGKALFKIERDPRVTAVGYWLRKFSLDELPQLFNIWKGTMSLVGPRPPLPYEVELYEDWQKKRLQAPPGLTGLWQVSGRNKISFEEMVRLDIFYTNNWSLENDMKIIFKTVATVLFSKGH
jgi:exopolysaccharide biosynthesis polyprenyl glycosylphosphotransferase